jgi:hypothetical protein
MKLKRKVELVFWMVTLGAVPAWANNPPQPDGLFSLILIFPVVIFGFRLAKASYTDGERKWRWLRGLLLGFLVVLAMAGDDVAQIPLLVFLIFGLRRGIQIMYRGQGRKRFFVGALVCLWTLFALGDYGISLMVWSPVPSHEFATIRNLRFLAQAEQTYARTSPSGQFATIKQLQDAKIPLATEFSQPGEDSNPALYDLYMNNYVYVGYRFSSMVDADGKKFLNYSRSCGLRKRYQTAHSRNFVVDSSAIQRQETYPRRNPRPGRTTLFRHRRERSDSRRRPGHNPSRYPRRS